MEKHKIWEFNGEETAIDLFDVENMERYEEATIELNKRQAEDRANLKPSERLKAQCEDYFIFFNKTFGDETASKRIFKGKKNVSECIEAYYDFLIFVAKQSEAEKARLAEIRKKYTQERIKK